MLFDSMHLQELFLTEAAEGSAVSGESSSGSTVSWSQVIIERILKGLRTALISALNRKITLRNARRLVWFRIPCALVANALCVWRLGMLPSRLRAPCSKSFISCMTLQKSLRLYSRVKVLLKLRVRGQIQVQPIIWVRNRRAPPLLMVCTRILMRTWINPQMARRTLRLLSKLSEGVFLYLYDPWACYEIWWRSFYTGSHQEARCFKQRE